MPLKAIIFDLDNTLMDFLKMKKEGSRAAAGAMVDAGLRMDKEAAADELYKLYLELGIDGESTFQEFLKRKLGEIDEKILSAAINAYLEEKVKHMVPYPNAIEMLKKLKNNYLLAILTDAPRKKALQRLELMGIKDFFDAIITHEDSGEKKPHELPFRKTLEILKAKPSEALMVGDSLARDIAGAKKLGMKTVFAKYGQFPTARKSDEKPDFVISDIGELPEIIKNL